jgi:hypothetical protein
MIAFIVSVIGAGVIGWYSAKYFPEPVCYLAAFAGGMAWGAVVMTVAYA